MSDDDLARRFERLAQEWHRGTRFVSSVSEIASHPAYQAIIAMGEPAIPLILRELHDHGGHWYMALRQLADDPPSIDPAIAGRVSDVDAIWLAWGRERGYLE